LIQIRQAFEQYICLRPAKLLPGVETPLANKRPGDIDMLIVRENSEGEYFRAGGAFKSGKPEEVAVQTAIHSRKGVTRIIRYGFERATRRSRRLAVATKSNALNYSMVLWDQILQEIAEEYPEIEASRYHIDALTMLFVREPERFDVVVGSNLFADILSDLAGALVGSLGVAPSANINPDGDFPSLFEPVHGSAPDISGKGIANPIAAVRSAAMMLEFLGEMEASRAIEESVAETLRDGQIRTPDLGGSSTTGEVGDELARRVAGF
jgi:tartrate dehydrogenase/decarboxylase/D-malate dehydrogenase